MGGVGGYIWEVGTCRVREVGRWEVWVGIYVGGWVWSEGGGRVYME